MLKECEFNYRNPIYLTLYNNNHITFPKINIFNENTGRPKAYVYVESLSCEVCFSFLLVSLRLKYKYIILYLEILDFGSTYIGLMGL